MAMTRIITLTQQGQGKGEGLQSHAKWTKCRGPWGRVPAWLCDWGRPSSLSLPSSSCALTLTSIAILLSGGLYGVRCIWVNLSFLVTIMGLVTPWSLTLALVDVYSVFFKRPSRQPGVMSVIVVGDWVCTLVSVTCCSVLDGQCDECADQFHEFLPFKDVQ
ncbi:hypothetical protein RHSIM_Rhsim08G0109900 [Rhododendron simsii]|uniref:CASP-like protein n=1 Tax=Rhododendron simsii TaxID=118357 RepID=A0A834GNS1_RHOSS|nr:hypothetical protein RHSIM_Rhsim08G0109900 [Rhododendron simsii]